MPDLPERRPRRAARSDVQRNRAKLIESARTLLADGPQVSMASISEHAGLGRNTIYRHFPTRDALIEAVREDASAAAAGEDAGDDGELDHLRPAGEVANVSPTPMSVWDVLNKVAPFQLGTQIIAEAQRLPGVTAAAIYLVDLDGRSLRRYAGPESFPAAVAIALAIGPEIDRRALAQLEVDVHREMPGVAVAPINLRGRATGVIVAVGAHPPGLRELAQEAAAAMVVAERYTGLPDRIRRTSSSTAAAELQQSLLPPRVVRIGGAMISGNVLPAAPVGGDWFDCTDNPEQAWLGVFDVRGRGVRAAAASAAALAAFRAARHDLRATPATAIHLMHDTLRELADRPPTASTTIATWNSATTLLQWVTCGGLPPLLADHEGSLTPLGSADQPRIGTPDLPRSLRIESRRLRPTDRVLFLSNGITERADRDGSPFGFEGVSAALRTLAQPTASTTLRAIQDAALAHSDQPLADDATLMVLAPT